MGMGVFMKNKLVRAVGIVVLIFVLGFSSAYAGTHKISSGKHKVVKHSRHAKALHKSKIKAKAKAKAKKAVPAKKPVKEIDEDDLPDESTEAEHPG